MRTADVQSYIIGTPNSPVDVQLTGRSGATFGMRDGMIYYYRSPGSLFHEQNVSRFGEYAGPARLDSNAVVQLASSALRRLRKRTDIPLPNRPSRVRQAEAYKG